MDNEVIEQAAKVGAEAIYWTLEWEQLDDETRSDATEFARALHEAGLLADPADRDELEAWRSGRRRKSWPTIESVPDGLHYAAELARAQGTEGGDAHDELLRNAAMRLKALHDVAPALLAAKERAEAEVAELQATVAKVRELHILSPEGVHCWECDEEYPCPTIRALDGGEQP